MDKEGCEDMRYVKESENVIRAVDFRFQNCWSTRRNKLEKQGVLVSMGFLTLRL